MTCDSKQSQRGLTRRDFLRMTAGMAIAALVPGCRRTSPAVPPSPVHTGWVETERYKKRPPWRIGRAGRGDLTSWPVMLSAHIEYGVREKYHEHFKDYLCTSANWEPGKQIQDIKALLGEGIDLLLIDPLDDTTVAAAVREAMDAGVPVIWVSSGVQDAPYVSWVTTNEEERGTLCADWLCRSIPGGHVVILQSDPAAGDNRLWLKGVRRRVDAQSNVSEVKVVTSFCSSIVAKSAMALTLREFPSIDGLIVNSGEAGRGAVEAFVEAGREIPPVAGGDDWNGWLRIAQQHQVRFLGLSGGANLGLRCVELAMDVLAGKPVPGYVEFPYEVFDDSAIGRYYRADLTDYYWAINDLPDAWIERMFKP
jgi:ribose transport system substrate-binding protein